MNHEPFSILSYFIVYNEMKLTKLKKKLEEGALLTWPFSMFGLFALTETLNASYLSLSRLVVSLKHSLILGLSFIETLKASYLSLSRPVVSLKHSQILQYLLVNSSVSYYRCTGSLVGHRLVRVLNAQTQPGWRSTRSRH